MKRACCGMFAFAFMIVPAAWGQTAADSSGIRRAALDYAESWYAGSTDQMERALHPELAKRIIHTDQQGRSRLDHMGAMRLVQNVRAGYGKQTPEAEKLKDVTILDIYRNTASVKVVMSGWIDYLHIAKWNGEWKIVNVLWELKPKE